MKEVKISFETSITLRQTDIHWIEEELLRIRQEVFKKVLKKDIYPIDRALGIEDREGITLGVKERVLWAAVEVSYEKASGFFKNHYLFP